MTLEEAIAYFDMHQECMCLLGNKNAREIACMLRELKNYRENLDIAKKSATYKGEFDSALAAKYCEGWKDAVDFMEAY